MKAVMPVLRSARITARCVGVPRLLPAGVIFEPRRQRMMPSCGYDVDDSVWR
jgi:hypothetical protein